MGTGSLFSASPLTGSRFSGSAAGSPLGGLTTFGFDIPQGSPGEIEAAAAQAGAAGMAFSTHAQDVRSAAGTASAGWQGGAQAAFADYAGAVAGVFNANSDAFTRAASVMSRFAQELEHAQQVTRQAAQECVRYQGDMTRAQGDANAHGQTAQTLYQQASIAAHPQVQGDLVRQAKSAEAQQQAAAQAASAAQGQLEQWQKRGRDAYHAYMQQAEAAARDVQAAAEQIRPAQALGGGAPVPVSVSQGDIAFAQGIFPAAAGLPGSAWSDNPGQQLQRLAGREVTPGEVLALYQMAEQEQAKGKGSLLDAAGGFVNTITFGAVSFGDPMSPRYRGGEAAAMIPIDPESLVIDADKAGMKLAAQDASRIDYSKGFEADLKNFVPGTASVHSGSLDGSLTLVQYSDKTGGGSFKWWTSVHDANNMPTVHDVMDKLALEPGWGPRDAVSVAHVPAGSDVTFAFGKAAKQPTTAGGAIQYRFREFDPAWIAERRPLP